MTEWLHEIGKNAAAHREEIEADLNQAIQVREHAKTGFEEADGRVKALKYLLAAADAVVGRAPKQDDMTLHDAMAAVLRSDPIGMMRAVHLAGSINERGLYRMQDGRPVEGQQVTARVGRYPDMFEKEGTLIKLKKE